MSVCVCVCILEGCVPVCVLSVLLHKLQTDDLSLRSSHVVSHVQGVQQTRRKRPTNHPGSRTLLSVAGDAAGSHNARPLVSAAAMVSAATTCMLGRRPGSCCQQRVMRSE